MMLGGIVAVCLLMVRMLWSWGYDSLAVGLLVLLGVLLFVEASSRFMEKMVR
jgi:hypothetical protein